MNYYDKLTDLGIKLTKRAGTEKTQCPRCYDGRKNKNRKDLSVNITTGEYCCHNTPCDFKGNVRTVEKKEQAKIFTRPDKAMLKNIELGEKVVKVFKERKISEKILQRYMVHYKLAQFMPQTPDKKQNCICFPYFRNSELINIKFRDAHKNFKMIAGAELTLFGLQFLGQRKHMIIVEGEPDCLTLAECGYGQTDPIELVDTSSGEVVEVPITKQKAKWCPVSVPNGTSDKGELKLEYLDNCFEDLIGIHEFIIAVDGDKAGRILKDELIRRLGIERCRFITYPTESVVPLENNTKRPCKDLNEVLMYLGRDAVDRCIETAQFIPIEGVYYLEDLYPKMLEKFKRGILLGETTRWGAEMDEHIRHKKGNVNLGVGYGNHGKALALDTLIPTPDGWTTMGDVKIGDKVFDENGKVCNVVGATEVMLDRECYELEFSDGTQIVADAEHLWETYTIQERLSEKNFNKRNKKRVSVSQLHKRLLTQVRTTKQIKNTFISERKDGRKFFNHSINLSLPLILPDKSLPIDPYVFGVWLGDGSSSDGRLTSDDIEIVDRIKSTGYEVRKHKADFMYGIIGLKFQLHKLGVLGNKYIPIEYLRSSAEQRMELLKGLMDTDGYIDKRGSCEFTTIREDFCMEVYELICSLGFKCSIIIGDAKLNGRFISKKYRILFKPFKQVFHLSRKKERHFNTSKNKWRYIVSCEKTISVPVKCISVDSDSNLYLITKSFIPTHNTTFQSQRMLIKSIYDDWKWAAFCPENYPADDYYDDLIEPFVGKWLSRMTEEEYAFACEFIGRHFFYVYPEDEHDLFSIHERFRNLVMKKGIDGVLLDPWNQLDKKYSQYGMTNEEKLSVDLKAVKRFALMNSIEYNILAHPKNPTYAADKSLPVVDMYDISGGAQWGNKCDDIWSYYRPNWHVNKEDPSVDIHFQKIKRKRTGGKLGVVSVSLDWETKRYIVSNGEIPCDPRRAEKVLRAENFDAGIRTELDFGSLSNDDDEDPF